MQEHTCDVVSGTWHSANASALVPASMLLCDAEHLQMVEGNTAGALLEAAACRRDPECTSQSDLDRLERLTSASLHAKVRITLTGHHIGEAGRQALANNMTNAQVRECIAG